MESTGKMAENPPVVVFQQKIDQECQVNIHSTSGMNSITFTCNRYDNDGICDAEIQTEIIQDTRSMKVANEKELINNNECCTSYKSNVNEGIQADSKNFTGFASITEDEQLFDLAGVTFDSFDFLLKRVSTRAKYIVSEKDRLLIFLMKMKTGLTFSALGVLFNVNSTIISEIFLDILQHLAGATRNLVFWPSIDVVKETTPNYFHPEYSNTRVIIDCAEFSIDIPESVENRVFTYSQYEKTFTARVLLGITPGGFISFKSKVAGGGKSDNQITIDTGLVDLLEDGDIVLAVKDFPEIKNIIDASSKNVQMIVPPTFSEDESEFSTEETYFVTNFRIYIERIMQRLSTYQILNKIPEELFHCIDDIMHICCVLVNLQPLIIASN